MPELSLQELRDLHALRELKARYFRTLDTKNWQAFRALFTDDAYFERQGAEPIDGADAFVEFTSNALAGSRTVHHGHTPLLEIDGPTEAHGSWLLNDYVEWKSDPVTGERRGIDGYGRYDESYRKIDGEWKISSWMLTYHRMDPLLREPVPPSPTGGPDQVHTARPRALADELPPSRHDEYTAEQLLDLELIANVRSRFFRLVDEHDWDGWRELFTDDLRCDQSDGEVIEGGDNWVAAVRGMMDTARTVHHAHTPELVIVSPTEAEGRWVLADYLEWAPEDPERRERHGVKGYGHEQDTYRKVDGQWKIATWHLSYVRFDALPLAPLPEGAVGGPPFVPNPV
jgi:hypothetical protein